MKRKVEENRCSTNENKIKNVIKKLKTSKESNKTVNEEVVPVYRIKTRIISKDVLLKIYAKRKKDKEMSFSKPNVVSETEINQTNNNNNKRKNTVRSEDSGNIGYKSNKNAKKTIRFQETVEVNTDGSTEKKEMKLKEDLSDNTHVTDMVTEINTFKKGKKKEKTKKEKKLEKQNEDSKLVQQQCIEHLKKWKNDKISWKFEKAKQIRLVNYMFDPVKLPDEVFPIFLEYISGSKGNIVKVIAQKCLIVVKEMEHFMELDEEKQDEKTKPDEQKYERARSVLQVVEDFN